MGTSYTEKLQIVFSKIFILNYVYMCGVCVDRYMYTYESRCMWRPEEDIRSLGAGVTGNCKQPNMGFGNQTLCSGSLHS